MEFLCSEHNRLITHVTEIAQKSPALANLSGLFCPNDDATPHTESQFWVPFLSAKKPDLIGCDNLSQYLDQLVDRCHAISAQGIQYEYETMEVLILIDLFLDKKRLFRGESTQLKVIEASPLAVTAAFKNLNTQIDLDDGT